MEQLPHANAKERKRKMQTTADNYRDKARENIDNAIFNLAQIVIDQVAGWDNYTESYYAGLEDALYILMHLRTKTFPK